MDIFFDILLKPPQPFIGLFFYLLTYVNECKWVDHDEFWVDWVYCFYGPGDGTRKPPPIAVPAVAWTQAQVVNSNSTSSGKETRFLTLKSVIMIMENHRNFILFATIAIDMKKNVFICFLAFWETSKLTWYLWSQKDVKQYWQIWFKHFINELHCQKMW